MTKDLILTTFNRPTQFKIVWDSIDKSKFRKIVVVHDFGGEDYPEDLVEELKKSSHYITFPQNVGVSVCKQTAVNFLIEDENCSDTIFIVEDDVLVKDNSVWDYYVNFSKASGIWHTNWNDCVYKKYKFKVNIENFEGVVTRDVAGAFSFFHKSMFRFCEYPQKMKNAFEHISVELQLIEKSLLPPFWNFVCPANSGDYLDLLDCESTITGKDGYSQNWESSNKEFIRLHGTSVTNIPDSDTDTVLSKLKFLKENYERK